MMAFPHQLLSEYVGTSREIVTYYLNQFRRQGFLKYSRKGIVLHGDGLERLLRRSSFKSSEGGTHRSRKNIAESD
jgi:CRP/FNR family cyclic AMP-dependent transcriptional regulator